MQNERTRWRAFWKDKYFAAKRVRRRFGLKSALEYLIGEKFVQLLHISDEELALKAELPAIITDIQRLFSPDEIQRYLYGP